MREGNEAFEPRALRTRPKERIRDERGGIRGAGGCGENGVEFAFSQFRLQPRAAQTERRERREGKRPKA